nr:hypothetical protein [Tanacetum cinerariifolium]
MADLSEDIQCAGSDTRPPMLDRTDFASWQQRIRLYCRGKDNGVNILKSIDEGPYKLGTFRETLAESTEGTPQFRLPKYIYTLINHYTDAKDIWDNVKMFLEGSELTEEDRESQLYDDFEHFRQHKEESINDYYVRFSKLINDMRNTKMTMPKLQLNSKIMKNMLPEWGRFMTAIKLNRGLRESNYDQLFAYLKQHEAHAKENKMVLERLSQPTVDPLALLSNVSNTQHGSPSSSTSSITPLPPPRGPNNAFNDDVNEQPVQDLALNVDNVFQAKDCDAFDSDNDNFMMIYNDMCKPSALSVSNSSRNAVVKNSLTAKLATYREQVKLYERRAKFELTEREQKINKQLRLVISDRNFEEDTLKWERHSTKLQLAFTINLSKSMVEEITFLKQDFKQKENKLLADFLNMKSLKEKVVGVMIG